MPDAVQADAVSTVDPDQTGRFQFTNTALLGKCMQACLASSSCPERVRDLCSQYQQQQQVPWRVLVDVYHAARELPGQEGLSLQQLTSASGLHFPSPTPRTRSAALQQRLEQLQQELDNKRYAAMVADVQPPGPTCAPTQEDLLPTTKLQLSYGLHVVVTMATFFALAYYGAKWALGSEAWAAAAGAVGLTLGMLLETSLLIIRSNMPESLDTRYAHLLREDYLEVAKQQQQQQQQQGGQKGGKGAARQQAAAAGGQKASRQRAQESEGPEDARVKKTQ